MRKGYTGDCSQQSNAYNRLAERHNECTATESNAQRGRFPRATVSVQGYPRLVARGDVPSQMRYYIDGPKAVAVAPGVWTQKIPGVSLLESAYDGAFIGYCASVEKALEKLGNENGYTCW